MSSACAICGKPVPPRAVNRSYPFCSDRCKLLDLGNWLGESYRIPGPRAGDGAPASGLSEPPAANEPDGSDLE